jgi:recombination protein RecR
MADSLEKLKEIFREFPGIGPRQAERFVYFLLHKNKVFREELVKEIETLAKSVRQCSTCFRFFEMKKDSAVCGICSDAHRDTSLLMVVPRDVDFESIEGTNIYKGLYFILGGTSAFSAKKQQPLRTKELIARIEKSGKDLKEVIIAVSLNPEGDNTRRTVEDTIRESIKSHGISVSTLGRGLSTGAEIEYIDRETLSDALSGRKQEPLP